MQSPENRCIYDLVVIAGPLGSFSSAAAQKFLFTLNWSIFTFFSKHILQVQPVDVTCLKISGVAGNIFREPMKRI